MKAIVLSCDRYVKMTEHMITIYQHKWPENPFVFRVPYNNIYPFDLKEKFGSKIELIHTKNDINSTVFKLIEDIPDEEMLYWCIDDKYLLNINIEKTNFILDYIKVNSKNIDGLGLTNRKTCISNNYIKINNIKFFKRVNYKKIWLHQFLKRKIIKHLFDNIPYNLEQAKHMDYFIREKIKFPFNNVYVCSESLLKFGESTKRGMVTKECKDSMRKYNIDIPINPKKVI